MRNRPRTTTGPCKDGEASFVWEIAVQVVAIVFLLIALRLRGRRSIQFSRCPLDLDWNGSGVLIFCLIVQSEVARTDPITDIFQTMYVGADLHSRLEAKAPWELMQQRARCGR